MVSLHEILEKLQKGEISLQEAEEFDGFMLVHPFNCTLDNVHHLFCRHLLAIERDDSVFLVLLEVSLELAILIHPACELFGDALLAEP